ncbi:hypothetical protein GUJ93_ZPchr0006g45335 [Zizania palustris]|uniref:BHLH domain-containing protein n=1 Tax=Zizania palustris TaxID=103762 RepID=A0A8J5T294_ZIZPA|nr:hypothetical protein GUJ93_ZPchr0006g45335 [Zizania palustris]
MAAMDMMSQEQLMQIISQLDRALTSSPSPSRSPSVSPPHQSPAAPVLSSPLYGYATMASSRAQAAPAIHHPAAATAVQAPQDVLYYSAATATTQRHQLPGIDDDDAGGPRPRRRNARVSSEPQSVAARLRRERVSQRMRALQRLVPGSARLDTASMLEEAVRYVKFLKAHVDSLELAAAATLHGRRRVDRADATEDGDYYSFPSY